MLWVAREAYTYYNADTMILFLHGKDTFRSRQQLKRIKEKFKSDRDPQGINVSTIVANSHEPSEILTEILSAPFLSEKRMVVIEKLLTSKHKELMKTVLDRINEDSIPQDTILVFWEGGELPKTKNGKALLERLKKEKFAQLFEELKGIKLGAWITQEIKERGGEISPEAVQYLATHIADTWQMSSIIDQLIAYSGEEQVTKKEAQVFAPEKVDDNIFNLVDAIVAGQTKKVFAMLQEQYRLGKDAGYILAMLIRQFRILLELRDLFDRDELGNSGAVAKELGLHPFVVKKTLPMVKRLSYEELRKAYEQLLEIDTKTKTGQADQSLLIDVFVGRQSL